MRRLLKRLVFGAAPLPSQFTLGMHDPQSEVSVWLDGLAEPLDVTEAHIMACASPLTIGVVLESEPTDTEHLSLRFQEREGKRCILGRIHLKGPGTPAGIAGGLRLFQVARTSNYCLPRRHLWMHYLELAYRRWRFNNNPEIQISAREAHAMIAFFICPRPAVLVSVVHEGMGNVFPMNLMGPIGGGLFAFALNSTRKAAPLVEQAGRLAISNIPVDRANLARQLGRNHMKDSTDLNSLPFATRPSPTFGFPVPDFAVRIRELEIQAHQRLGSHTLFVARIICDEQCAVEPEFFYIHGIYQAWRRRHGRG